MMKMKNSMLMLLASAFIVFSCSDDEGPKEQFSVEGDSYELTRGYTVTPDQGEDDDGNDIYVHNVILTGKDLKIQVGDGIEITGTDDVISFTLISSEDEIEEGTYELDDDDDAGTVVQLLAYTDYHVSGGSQSYDRVYGGTADAGAEGTIKVSKSGDTYTFKINLTTYLTEGEDDETVEGEGSLKGYFKGKLELLEEEGPARKSKVFSNPFTEGLAF